ncbi:hypothetical protein [Catellatospora vulcania]|uniref:hypothetical protein n=1 Tax=Catellatospora vulcania TaxID=1460450 RepID=UPI0012D4441A|nr:hypothetical protein [Catellatospora vulcania]
MSDVQVNLRVAEGFRASVEAGRDAALVLAVGVSGVRLAVSFDEGSGLAGLEALRRFAAAVQVFATMAEARELQRIRVLGPIADAELWHILDVLREGSD